MSLPIGRAPRYRGNPWTDPDPPAPGTPLTVAAGPTVRRPDDEGPGADVVASVPGPGWCGGQYDGWSSPAGMRSHSRA